MNIKCLVKPCLINIEVCLILANSFLPWDLHTHSKSNHGFLDLTHQGRGDRDKIKKSIHSLKASI